MHLGESVTDRPLCHFNARQVVLPVARCRDATRILAQLAIFCLQQSGNGLVIRVGQARAVGIHAFDDADPLLFGTFVAHERRGLLVTERAIQLEGPLEVLIAPKA